MRETKKAKLLPQADLLLEISWEVCNKIGGINTVLATKAVQMVRHYGQDYIMIGPYFAQNSKYQFEEKTPEGDLKEIFDNLEGQGIHCRFGRWLIDGDPQVILVDFQSLWPNINGYKRELWDHYKVDSMESGFEFDEPVVWGYAVARLVEQMKFARNGKKTVVHCHEWLAGAALLFAKKFCSDLASVFTTHATTLGRSMAFNGVDIYSNINKIDSFKEAYNYHVQAKHLLEKAAANACTVFTTVSEITGVECEYFLGRMPDVFLPNGLDVSGYLSFEEAAIKHRIQRARIREFLFYNFFPHYVFDLKNTLFYFMMARYEYHAKGIDSFIKALGDLNQKLKAEKSRRSVVAFLWVPAKTNGVNPDLIENRGNYFDVKEFVEENSGNLVENFLYSLFAGRDLKDTDVFDDDEPHRDLERRLKKTRRTGDPLVCTHNLEYRDDEILKGLIAAGLENKKDDRVKVVFYPAYLTGTDKLLNLNVREAIQGCHLGVFPSYYEPWGYTPLEAAAEGVPAITSDLSGLGRFIKRLPRDKQNPGIFIVNNDGKSEAEVDAQLGDILYDYATMPQKDRVANKINAREMVNNFDWEDLAENYVAAHNKSLENVKLKDQN
ncbi:MAG: glycogen/starch synthase [Candidatus Nealsonbacteria bacterium DGGOD1a]|nr:MAG: glycogen/starch synthase [Candidatus Nealsonbacteria bacterium DGGOD1a]